MHAALITKDMIDQAVAFHGHTCPGLAIGIRAAEVALREIGPHAEDEEMVAVVETDMCGVDAIQYLTGCTFGKGNLIHLDYGKNAFSFYRRSDGKAIRVVARAPAPGPDDAERESLYAKVRAEAPLTPEEQEQLDELRAARIREILEAPLEVLFDFGQPQIPVPRHARILESVTCASCGERVMETRLRHLLGKHYCIPCFERLEQQ